MSSQLRSKEEYRTPILVTSIKAPPNNLYVKCSHVDDTISRMYESNRFVVRTLYTDENMRIALMLFVSSTHLYVQDNARNSTFLTLCNEGLMDVHVPFKLDMPECLRLYIYSPCIRILLICEYIFLPRRLSMAFLSNVPRDLYQTIRSTN